MNFYILAGGQSRRMGRNKALLKKDGQTLIERVISALPAKREDIKIVACASHDYDFLSIPVIPDRIPGLGPIGGIHAGLTDSGYQANFFVACDLPFISCELIEKILKNYAGQDVFGVRSNRGREPLCTVYSKRCLPAIESQIQTEDYSLHNLFELLDAEFMLVEDPKLFTNLNTQQDWHNFVAQPENKFSGS
ncbi:MAG: molybdenum cofactor guanylyltransferase [bacterium]